MKNLIVFKKYRCDYFLIWANGLRYKDEIIEIIRRKSYLEIIKIHFYNTKNIKNLVKAIYSYDYAPFLHLKSKTKYLLSKKPHAIFIIVKNNNVREVLSGEGQFRHIECEYIKSIKEEIRNKFNERKNGIITENHVIHAPDNESQTDYILKYLGFREGIKTFENTPNKLLDTKHHITNFNKFIIRYVKMSKVYCNILKGKKDSSRKILTSIEKTPHYKFLKGNVKPYIEYLNEFSGHLLQDDYSVSKFTNMSRNFSYLKEPFNNHYILTKEFKPNEFHVLDGVHRASILKFQGYEKFIVAVAK